MKKYFNVLFLFMLSSLVYAQPVFHSVNNTAVYDFLERMSLKRIVTSNEFQKPLTRSEIAIYLVKIDSSKAELNSIEKEELAWYEKEFYDEMHPGNTEYVDDLKNGVLNSSAMRRLRPFYYRDSLFIFNFSESALLTGASKAGESYQKLSWGFKLYGEITNNFGFSMSFLENSENGKTIDKSKQLSSETGAVFTDKKNNSAGYSETTGSLLYGNSWITTGLTKELMTLGSGYRSQLVLSTKAPSFPSLYMKIHPAKWISFYFMHGWLLSGVTDSLATYKTELVNQPRTIEREKYYVMHAIQIVPTASLSMTFGETIIYSDKSPYLGYFIPFLFYRSVDHAISFGGAESGNNGSIFFDMSYYTKYGVKLYGTLFIDEFSLTNFLKGNSSRNQIGYTLGSVAYNAFIPNLTFRVEYSKILPWVYSNWIPSQTYRNSNYILGHYIGQNADQIFTQVEYQFARGLSLKVWAENVRQGGVGDIKYQYTIGYAEKFLYGMRRNETNFGMEVSYEYLHDLIGKVFYQYSHVTDEDSTRTPAWQLGNKNTFGISLQYGL
jgi:hypothetical protein